MLAVPGHGRGKLDYGINRVKQRSVPMVLQNAPTALNRIILAVIRWVIGQAHGESRLLHEVDHALHELGASAMVLWSIIEIEYQHADVPKALAHRFPPALQAIDHAITRDFGGNAIQKQFIHARQEDADRRDGRGGLKVMVGRRRWDAALPTPRKRTNFDRRFRVHRDA